MSSLLKDIYSPSFFERFSEVLSKIIPSFSRQVFQEQIFTDEFQYMELKERMRHTTLVLHRFLPEDYAKAMKLIEKLIIKLRAEQFGEYSLVFMFLPDYIETYGLDHYNESVKALELVTQFISCEFAM
jgi:3-methyladenine DNA glycosylase AlkC